MSNQSDQSKKQVPLRLSPNLYAALAEWAEYEFRSVNGQIEYLLTECVKKRGISIKISEDKEDAD